MKNQEFQFGLDWQAAKNSVIGLRYVN